MVRRGVVVFLGLLACASRPATQAPAVEPAPVVVAAPTAPAEEPAAAPPEAPAPAAAPPVCRVESPPPAVPEPPPGRCAAVAKKVQAELQPRLERNYFPRAPGARLVSRYGCDPLKEIVELVFESGDGHGQGLALTRLRRQGGKISALRIVRQGLVKGAPATRVLRAELEEAALVAALPAVRGLLLVQLAEELPPDPRGGSARGSSGSRHGFVRLVDADGRARERGFTGSDDSATQLDSLPVAELAALLGSITEAIPWRQAEVDAEVRALFVSRFLAFGPDQSAWWVRERLVLLAADVGTPALVPRLIALASDVRVDASVQRTREHALAALAALAGFDARRNSHGALLSADEAAATYARVCAP